jgi:hypothetical protein
VEERSVPALGRARRRSNGRACRTRSNKGCEPPGADPGGQAMARARAGLGPVSVCACIVGRAAWDGRPRSKTSRSIYKYYCSSRRVRESKAGVEDRPVHLGRGRGGCASTGLATSADPSSCGTPFAASSPLSLACAALRSLLFSPAQPTAARLRCARGPPSPCLDNAVTVTVTVASRASMLLWCGVEGKSEEAAPSMDAGREGGVTSDAALRHGLAVSEQGRPAVHVELLLSASCCGHHINNPPAALAF